MRVLLLGRHEILYATAQRLIEQGRHSVVGIITAKASPEYRKNEQDFEQLAQECAIPFHLAGKIDKPAREMIAETQPDIAVSVNWISILKEDVTGLFPRGILNAHFGNLPRYRGNAVTNWALLQEESEIVLTVHMMAPSGLDSGDILCQKRMSLTGDTTIRDINDFALLYTPTLFQDVLDGFEENTLIPRPQSQSPLTPFRCYPRLPRDGKIDWALPARKIHALIRSLAKPYSGAYTYYRTADGMLEKLYIWESRLVSEHTDDIGMPGHVIRNDRQTGESWIYTGDGILAITLASEGEEMFAPGKVWNSIRMRLGMDVEEELFQLVQDRSGR